MHGGGHTWIDEPLGSSGDDGAGLGVLRAAPDARVAPRAAWAARAMAATTRHNPLFMAIPVVRSNTMDARRNQQ